MFRKLKEGKAYFILFVVLTALIITGFHGITVGAYSNGEEAVTSESNFTWESKEDGVRITGENIAGKGTTHSEVNEWYISPTFPGAMTSNFTVDVPMLDLAAYFRLFIKGAPIETEPVNINSAITTLSMVFGNDPGMFTVEFYSSPELEDLIATATCTGNISNGTGTGALIISLEDDVVYIPDSNLESVIRSILNKPAGDIKASDMETITYLNLNAKGIEYLTGLEYAVNLRDLYFSDNQVRNISSLANLTNLETLYMPNNYLDITEGSDAMVIIQQLMDDGVEVTYIPQKEQPLTSVSMGVERLNSSTLKLEAASSGGNAVKYRFDMRTMGSAAGNEGYTVLREYSTDPEFTWTEAADGEIYEIVVHAECKEGEYIGHYVVFANHNPQEPVEDFEAVTLTAVQIGDTVQLKANAQGGTNLIYRFQYSDDHGETYQDVLGYPIFLRDSSYTWTGAEASITYYFAVHVCEISSWPYVYKGGFTTFAMN